MSIKFYASIPVSYLTPDLPPGRYLVPAAGLWDRRKERFKWEKLDCLDPERHEIIIDSGGYNFDQYPDGYRENYNHIAKNWGIRKSVIAPVVGFMQIDRIYDVDFTQGNRIPETIPIVRAECGNVHEQIRDLPKDCQFLAIGGLKTRTSVDLAHKALFIMETAKKYRNIKRFHLLGAGLKFMSKIRCTLKCEYYADIEISCDSGSWNSRFGSKINEFNAIVKANGWTQRETALRHYLPRYRKEIES